MDIIAHIDRQIYQCISDNITTTDVIITEERIRHIKDRHPNDYEAYSGFIPEVIEHPDYILASSRPDTAVLLKAFDLGEERFQLVLRLMTARDGDWKNSVITFLRISERTWNKYLRHKKVLYKRNES